MIPEKLSNKICSLRPNEDKLCLSVVLTISENGVIKNPGWENNWQIQNLG